MLPVTKTEYAPNIKHALINKMRLLSRIYVQKKVISFSNSVRKSLQQCCAVAS